MPEFSKTSMDKLLTCHPKLIQIVGRVIKVYDITVLEGFRGQEAQTRAVAEGKSKTPWPKSKHNVLPSLAVDVAPYPVDWSDYKRFAFLAGVVFGIAYELQIKVRWGGDFNGNMKFDDERFVDSPHFELKGV